LPAHGQIVCRRVTNRCLSSATACLYGLSEAAILAAGYAPAVGFHHRGKLQSFVYDVAPATSRGPRILTSAIPPASDRAF
jgi:hypothetical protein